MKSPINHRFLGFRFFIPSFAVFLLTLSTGIPSYASDSGDDFQAQLLEMSNPQLPPLKNPELYLYSADEVMNIKLILSLGQKQVKVYQQDELIASFPVAVGKKGWETPVGEFEIMQLIENPSWQNPWTGKVIPPGRDNPLGERWIGFWTDGKNFIGFHGTPGEHLIGQAVSHGCVRMKNNDIKELFKMVSMGTPVKVVQ